MAGSKPSRRPSPKNRPYAETDPANQSYLGVLGTRIRSLRSQQGMTRKMLAAQSGVSERFLAELETGSGNASVLLLRHLAHALDVPVASLVFEGRETSVELAHTTEFLRQLAPDDLHDVQQWLAKRFGQVRSETRRDRIALIGVRGAGKSTIG